MTFFHGGPATRQRRLIAAGAVIGLVLAGGLAWWLSAPLPGKRAVAATTSTSLGRVEESPPTSGGTPSTMLPLGVDSLASAPRPAPGTIPLLPPRDPHHVVVWRVETTRKVVALTFDDGPSPYTPLVMAALERAHVPATFFCIGEHAQEYPQEVAGLKAAGFEVENHTWDHRWQTLLPKETIVREITAAEAVLGPTKYFRPPGDYYNLKVEEVVASLGMMLIRWDADTIDWGHQDVPFILGRVKQLVRPGSIILMHDGGGDRSQTAAAIPEVVAWLRSQGYTFVTIDQLVTGGYGPTAATLYRAEG